MSLLSTKQQEQQQQQYPTKNKPSMPWVAAPPQVVYEPTTTRKTEKPYIFVNNDDDVYLAVPKLKEDSAGVQHAKLKDDEKFLVDNDQVAHVFFPNPDRPDLSFAEVQKAADNGVHIILSPGTYNWGQTLKITCPNQVVLGLGMATIQAPGTGEPCIYVSPDAHGVRLSGLSLEASVISKFVYEGSTLLLWGNESCLGDSKHATQSKLNPGAIHDLYCFVGGRSLNRTVKTQCMVKIFSNSVIGDNLWLWRADHVAIMPNEAPNRPELSEYHVTTFGECICDTGLEVFGDDVIFHGLAVEHTYKDMVIWHGKRGQVYFYQSELPYDVPGDYYKDYAGYVVNVGADDHIAKGVGVYSYFRDYDDVVVESAILHYSKNGVYENAFTVWLNGYSGIKSVINGEGGPTFMPGTPVKKADFGGKGICSLAFLQGILKMISNQK